MRYAALLTLALLSGLPCAAQPLVLRGEVHAGGGAVSLADGGVVLNDGKIVFVGPWSELEVPPGAEVVALPGAQITPGLIDANSTAGIVAPESWTEHADEVVPHLRVLSSIDLYHDDFRRLAARGVTTVYVGGGPGSVIGGQGAVLKTAGKARVLREAGAVKATFGTEAWTRGAWNRRPSRRRGVPFTARRPNTRMGMVWVFREAMSRASKNQFEGPAGEALREVLAGRRQLRIQARRRNDIETAIRLAREARVSFVLEEATEAYYVLDQLVRANVPVIYGPIYDTPRGYRARTGEARDPCLSTPRLLADRGIPFCLTANDRRDEDGLWAQAMLAIRYGLSEGAALTAVTSSAAAILGGDVAARVGVLASGYDADLVVWSGEPFEATTRPLAVLIDGQLVAGDLSAPASEPAPEEKAPEKKEF